MLFGLARTDGLGILRYLILIVSNLYYLYRRYYTVDERCKGNKRPKVDLFVVIIIPIFIFLSFFFYLPIYLLTFPPPPSPL